MSPRISIVIPCFNGEKFLRETLDCLQNQTIDDWECVIVNDGSTDNSLEIMREYAENDSRYKYIDKKNEGPSIARNTAIAASSGEYILPLDADDIISPSYAEKAISIFKNDDSVKLVYCKAELFGDKTGPWVLPDYSYQELLWINMIFCSAIYKRCDYDKTNGYNPNMVNGFEDWDFWLSLLSSEDKVYQIQDTLFHYRKSSFSRSSDAQINYEKLLEMIYQNHREKYSYYDDKYLCIINQLKIQYLNNVEYAYHSLSYKLGYKILHPIVLIQRFIKKTIRYFCMNK